MYGRASRTVETPFATQTFIRGGATIRTRKVTLLTGANHVTGEVLGIVTSSGKAVLSASGATDGSQVPLLVLSHDADATTADREAIAYETVDFMADRLILGTGHTLSSIREGLRAKGITFG